MKRLARRAAAALAMLAALGAAAAEEQLFYVRNGADVLPLAALRNGQLAAFPRDAARMPATRQPYFQFGAGQATFVALDGAAPTPCRPASRVRAGTGGADSGILSALPLRDMASSTPRDVTPAERTLLASMGKQVLARFRVPPHYAARLLGPDSAEVRRSMVALPQRGAGKPLLFASYALDYVLAGRSGTVALVLLAEPSDTGTYLATFKDVDQGDTVNGAAFRKFIANADLDGDGMEELILHAAGYEQSGYEVLSRSGGKWQVVLSTGEDGC